MTDKNITVRLRKLGGCELYVSPVGLGCLQMSRGRGIAGMLWPSLDDYTISEIVRVSLENGVNWFDTAELYGRGESERSLAKALAELKVSREDAVIATKWWPLFRSAGSITDTIRDRLGCLASGYIDLLQIHNPYSFSSIRSQMREMAGLIKDGRVRYAGVSNFSARQMRSAHRHLAEYGFGLVSNQVNYSLLKRDIEKNGVLDAAKELGVSVIAYSPLGRGLLTGKFHDEKGEVGERGFMRRFYTSLNDGKLGETRPVVEALKSIGEKYGKTPSQVALNWVINSQGESVVAIPGATKPSHAKDNALAMTFRLSDDDISYLSSVSAGFV